MGLGFPKKTGSEREKAWATRVTAKGMVEARELGKARFGRFPLLR